ncbi:aspartate kinase [Chryseotalea sanaruensis]|uniref:Aspartokinase n=1 Tax=Chryseotalea sanaruensis TaxID=2482724 RepID=A0A401U5K5_9BACT|nr:aspartate kinase [Chryseotalea sanaruensis]GCC50149.1 aspartate kinase [Chryseotalea sanaruensis]
MRVFKFGGASVKNAPAVVNTASIIHANVNGPLMVVVSAMGKTTNALELIVNAILSKQDYKNELQRLKDYHLNITNELFKAEHPIHKEIITVFDSIDDLSIKSFSEDQLYDQVVSLGEILSTLIVAAYVNQNGDKCTWLDAREFIKTDSNYRESKVDWDSSKLAMTSINFEVVKCYVTQGFIGRSTDGLTTTLGREGSDFTAAIFASCLDATSVTIWKDVPGVMNADPKRLPAAIVFEELPFKEAAEMTYYGASVIHPKTIKPLANAGIPLLVKNFDNPKLPGTRIHECNVDDLPPLIVFKDNQCLISCKVVDYTFIDEAQLGIIFKALAELSIKINLMQNSAISFSFCVDFRENKILKLIESLQHHFEVYYNTGLTLITIKNYDEKTFDFYRKQKGVMLEQSSRSTLQVLIKA